MNTNPPPDLDFSILIELDAAGRCLTVLRALAGQSVPRERFEVIGVCAAGLAVPEPVRQQLDWLLADPRGQGGALHLGFNRAARLASGRIVVRCDASAELPPGFLECLSGSFAAEGGSARQPVVTLQGGDSSGAKLALALHRQDAQFVLAAGRTDMLLEDAAWLLVESGAQHLRLDAGGPAAAAVVLDWRDIPVFIVNRNRHEAMVRLIDWLRAGGTRKIVILDNASTYPPLLQYYDALPQGVNVLRLPQNHGPYVLWQQRVHEVLDTPYVLTDSDIVPAEFCPADLWASSTRRCAAIRMPARSARRCASTTCPTVMPMPTPCASGRASSGSTRWRRASSPRRSTPLSRCTRRAPASRSTTARCAWAGPMSSSTLPGMRWKASSPTRSSTTAAMPPRPSATGACAASSRAPTCRSACSASTSAPRC
ncbi:hypothetical protein FSC37_02025 [Piscinibacter aquaticus]|uniref:Glycosyltransferase n=1 Tax=Piscinibacter aquaticus TaxID=392597 RepID=A0A5C6TYE8_9BURK|nr:hypothetical protein FSC37_02025 [Piscinibacter aquaticus]